MLNYRLKAPQRLSVSNQAGPPDHRPFTQPLLATGADRPTDPIFAPHGKPVRLYAAELGILLERPTGIEPA
jgi:hypothetical protein